MKKSLITLGPGQIVMNFSAFSDEEPADCYLSDMFAQLSAVVAAKPSERINILEGKLV